MKARICEHGAGKARVHGESGCAGRETNCPEVDGLRGAVVRVENVEEVAITVVEHAAFNLAEVDATPIRVRIAGALTVDSNWALVPCPGCAPRHSSQRHNTPRVIPMGSKRFALQGIEYAFL